MTPMGPSAGNPGKFTAARVTTGPDKSAGKTIITGDSGVGKTFFLSTIVSDDGRPIFFLPIEEGLKGASPLHSPAKFCDGKDNPILPTTFTEMMAALRVFKTEVNASRPPTGWVDTVVAPDKDAERRALEALVNAHPFGLRMPVLADRIGKGGVPSDIVQAFVRENRARVDGDGLVYVRPDAGWRRPHLHLGVDSLSGAETLIHREVLGRNYATSMADKEFNALFVKALPLWEELRNELDAIRRTGVHVWVVAHATKSIDASRETGDLYTALDLMFRGSGRALVELVQFWRQWADSIFYVVRDVAVTKGGKDRRNTASFRGRRLVTAETATCRAKSRLPLPASLPATWVDLKNALKEGAVASPEKLRSRIATLLPRLDVGVQPEIAGELDAAGQVSARLAALLSRVEGLLICAEEARAEAAALSGEPAAPQGAAPSTDASDTSTPPAQPAASASEDDVPPGGDL